MYKGNTSDPDINTTGNKTNTSVKIPTNDHPSPTPFARAPHPYRSIKDIRDNKT
jgi:hypothetical protein